MKVVINKCYGGFGLSQAALQWLIDNKGWTVEDINTEEEWENTKADIVNLKTKEREWLGPLTTNRTDDYADSFRIDADVVAVVEALGKTADGKHAELKVVEIPDGIEWDIKEYDGIEWIAENHRTWG